MEVEAASITPSHTPDVCFRRLRICRYVGSPPRYASRELRISVRDGKSGCAPILTSALLTRVIGTSSGLLPTERVDTDE
jgi:hypothetical protein